MKSQFLISLMRFSIEYGVLMLPLIACHQWITLNKDFGEFLFGSMEQCFTNGENFGGQDISVTNRFRYLCHSCSSRVSRNEPDCRICVFLFFAASLLYLTQSGGGRCPLLRRRIGTSRRNVWIITSISIRFLEHCLCHL